jgi:AcrR family transcriptional regulator
MARRKLISDADILKTVLLRLLQGGDRAISLREVARATGLSAPALVLRFKTQQAMMIAALVQGWAILRQDADIAGQNLDGSPKSVQDMLKNQADLIDIPALLTHSLRHKQAAEAANTYREAIEQLLAQHYGGGAKGRNAAGAVFAAWQGRLAWGEAGGKSFRFGEMIRSLG